MIVFIDLGKQIQSEIPQFAFFNTLTDNFMCFSWTQVFSSKKEFISYLKTDSRYPTKIHGRFISKIPDSFDLE